jgi:predicted O-methyltransferase YrrM
VPTHETLQQLLSELYQFGQDNDSRETEYARRMLNITPETGQLLAILVRATRATHILELAAATRDADGHVLTIERLPAKAALARANFARASLSDVITLREGSALDILPQLQDPFDLIFLDADRSSYGAYLDSLLGLLRPGGLLITDNVVSHAHELTSFLAALRAHPLLETVTLPFGNGEELSYKRRSSTGEREPQPI